MDNIEHQQYNTCNRQ